MYRATFNYFKSKITYLLLFFGVAALIIITLKGLLIAQPGDENTYYYMGRLISEGKIPYTEFFYAHPPLHIYLTGLLYSLFGFNILILKLMPLMCTITTAFFIFLIAKSRFGKNEALISFYLFLFSYSIMFNSVFSFGIEWATMFLVAGLYFMLNRNNYIFAALFFCLSSLTRLLALIPIISILAIFFWHGLRSGKIKNGVGLAGCFLAFFLIANGILFLIFGSDYINQALKFHLLKTPGGMDNLREYIDIIKLNWILFFSPILLIFSKDKKPAAKFVIVVIAYLACLAILKKIFGFYFIPVFPFLALIGGFGIVSVYNQIPKKFSKRVFLAAIAAAFLWNLYSDTLFLQKYAFVGFSRGDDLAQFIGLNSKKETLLFGDDSVTPLLALMTGKHIALHFVDTNNEVLLTGERILSGTLSVLRGKDIMFIIRNRHGISSFSEVKSFLNGKCSFLASFHDKMEGDYLFYRCV